MAHVVAWAPWSQETPGWSTETVPPTRPSTTGRSSTGCAPSRSTSSWPSTWARRFDGGFIGVDVFFVLSGYLVTQLLLRDIHSQGRIGFSRFYSRRFRRLLPASFVVLLVTAAVFAAVAAPVEVIEGLR